MGKAKIGPRFSLLWRITLMPVGITPPNLPRGRDDNLGRPTNFWGLVPSKFAGALLGAISGNVKL